MSGTIHTQNHMLIGAPVETVYQLAQDVARWPDILPHYRYVRMLEDGNERRLVAMSATRSGIPVRWISIQELHPEVFEVRYRHVAGATRGMDVVWRIRPAARGTEVTIYHDLVPDRWWLRSAISRAVVGSFFVMHIADRTLQGVKRRAEAMG